MAHIFNLSHKNGTFPSALKLSRVIPIHKAGKTDLCDNYRLIALLSSISKTLKKIVYLQLVNHLKLNKLISPPKQGPILFLVYIEDLPSSSLLETFLFSDDNQGLMAGKNLPELIDNVNFELKKWAQWFRSNKMAVNTHKTKFIIFHSKGKKVDMSNKTIIFVSNDPSLPYDPNLVSTLDRIHFNHPDPSSQSYKRLGILFDVHLTFSLHVDSLKAKLSKSLFCINRVKKLYISHFLFPPPLLPSNSQLSPQILCRQNLYYAKEDTPLHHQLEGKLTYTHINSHPSKSSLIIKSYIKLNFSFFTLSITTMPHPHSSNSWKINSDRDTQHEFRNANDYQIPPAKLTFFTRFPLHTLPKTRNNAGIITCYSNPTTFKIALYDELLNGNEFNRVHLPLPTPHPTSPLTTDPQSPYKFNQIPNQ